MRIEMYHGLPVPRFKEKPKRKSILESYPELQTLKVAEKLPNGIAIILDGNGRWAKERGLPTIAGHKAGAEAAKKLMYACIDLEIDLAMWIISPDNMQKRSPEEVQGIFQIFESNIDLLKKTASENNGKVIHIGELDGLPGPVRLKLRRVQSQTKKNTGARLGLAMNYDQERYVKSLANGTSQSQSEIKPADVVIRTGKVQRLSGFGLPFVGSNSELFFPPVYLPDFNEEHLKEILIQFPDRERTLGGRNGYIKEDPKTT